MISFLLNILGQKQKFGRRRVVSIAVFIIALNFYNRTTTINQMRGKFKVVFVLGGPGSGKGTQC
jgi:hypothetical protein